MAFYFKIVFQILDIPSFMHFMNCMSYLLKNPGAKIRHVLVIVSERQGIGKTSLLAPFTDYYKNYGLNALATDFLDKYTEMLDGTQFIAINDPDLISIKQKKRFNQKMKNFIAPASQIMNIKQKHNDDHEGFNCFFMVITCNNLNDLHIIEGDRRYMVIQALDKPVLPPEFFFNYNTLYKVEDSETYIDQHSIAKEQITDTSPVGVKDIIGAFQRWDYENPKESFLELTGILEGFGILPDTDTDSEIDLDSFEAFNPSAPPPKTEAFYEMADASINPYLKSILEAFPDDDFIFDFQLVELFNEGISIVNPNLPFEVKDIQKRRTLLEEAGYFRFQIIVYDSSSESKSKRARVNFFSRLFCEVRKDSKRGKGGTEEERNYNSNRAKEKYKQLMKSR